MSVGKSAFVRFIVVTAIFIVLSPSFADEASTARRFEFAKKSVPQLVAFLKDMPKGADLHTHVSGAVYAESRLDAAIDSGLYFDTKTGTFTSVQGQNTVPASELRTNSALASLYIDTVSMRGYRPSAAKSGHDHFFATFGLFGVPGSVLSKDLMLAEVIGRAKAQNVQYMELMTGVAPDDAYNVASAPVPIDDFEKAFEIMRSRFPALISASKSYLDDIDKKSARLLGFDSPITSTKNPITVRYIATVYRLSSNESFFAQMACAMAIASADPRVVGVTMLGPEDDVMSRQNFDMQMRIVDFLWRRLGKPKMALHAGELTLDVSPVEVMRSRIRKSIEIGHAQRIGHGVSVAWEDDLIGLLREMKARRVDVEICLTSNEGILNVSGSTHPFLLYCSYGVPMNLNTDDEGVSRSNITMEYVKAVRDFNLSYRQLKNLARNGIEYSFLPGESLYINGNYALVRPEFKGIRSVHWVASTAAKRLMAKSEKLYMQVRLERAFVDFEN